MIFLDTVPFEDIYTYLKLRLTLSNYASYIVHYLPKYDIDFFYIKAALPDYSEAIGEIFIV